jgi:hypothetical protein
MKDDFVSDEAKQADNLNWDKFMNDIVKRETDFNKSAREHMERYEDHPTRKLDRRIRETPHNRTRFTGKK